MKDLLKTPPHNELKEILFLSPGTALEQSSPVQPGDELLQVHTTVMQGLTRFEAWNIIKALPDGPITAVIKRKNPSSVTIKSSKTL